MTERLLEFWSLFAGERAPVAGGVGLSSRPAPLSFANGVWGPEPDAAAAASAWCRAREMPAAVLTTGTVAAGRIEAVLTAKPVAATVADAPSRAGEIVRLEQIGWMHIRPLAELVAYRYDRMDIETELVACLTAAMERQPRLEAYLAYDETTSAFTGGGLGYAAADRDAPLLIWAEDRGAHDVAAAIAARSPERRSFRLISSAAPPEPTAAEPEPIWIARIGLDPV